MNIVTLIGHLATEVELRALRDDHKVAGFLLAIDRPNEGADFVWVTAWDRQAEVCAEYLGKGKRVAVDGRLRSHSWDDPDGKRRTKVEVVANRVQFLSPPSGERAEPDEVPFEAAAV